MEIVFAGRAATKYDSEAMNTCEPHLKTNMETKTNGGL